MAFRRPNNRRDLLVRARLKPDPINDEPLGKCNPVAGLVTSSSGARVKLKGDFY